MSGAWTPTVRRRVTGAFLAAVVTMSAMACARDEGSGGGLPALGADEHVDGEAVPFQGLLRIGPHGCLMARITEPSGDAADRWVVWPTGAGLIVEGEDAGDGALVDDERYVKGDRITGTGLLVDLAALPGGGERGGGYYAEVGPVLRRAAGRRARHRRPPPRLTTRSGATSPPPRVSHPRRVGSSILCHQPCRPSPVVVVTPRRQDDGPAPTTAR